MKYISILALLLTGCAYHPLPITVYGASGKTYIAPDLCAAQVQCKLANEKECYYNATEFTRADGSHEHEACRAAK
jgi:hypothetical protein